MRFHFSIYCCNGSENTKDILWSSKFRGYRRTETLGLGWPQRSWHSNHQALLNAESSFFQNNEQAQERPNGDSEHKYSVLTST